MTNEAKRVADLRKGDRIRFSIGDSRRIGVVQNTRQSSQAELLPDEFARWAHGVVIIIYLFFPNAIPVPDVPEWRTNYFNIALNPDEIVYLHK